MKTTKDCKDFISLIQKSLSTKNNKWKRIRKYKDGEYILRDFENEEAFILIIAEKNDELSIHATYQSEKASLQENNVVSKYSIKNGFKYLGEKAKDKDLTEFIAECVKDSVAMHSDSDKRLVYGDDYIDGVKATEWEVEWSGKTKKIDQEFELILNYNKNNEPFKIWARKSDESDQKIELELKDIYKVHSVCMPKYDTGYRYVIFETHDHHLLLGFNNSD